MRTTESCILCEREITQTMKESRTGNLGLAHGITMPVKMDRTTCLERKGGDAEVPEEGGTIFLLC